MKQSAYGTPIFIQNEKVTLLHQSKAIDEASIQKLVFEYPSCLPISEIDESYNPAIPICAELNTPVGPLDIFMVSPNGEIIIIETKLWRNPEARRVVVAQILDYAKELSKWTYEDLQREVNRRLNKKGNTLYELAKNTDVAELLLDEADFIDSVGRNLRRGKFLLLIVGDGIREGASGITEFLTSVGHLNFTFAMTELAVYKNGENETIIMPRVLAKTVELQKITVEIPYGLSLASSSDSNSEDFTITGENPERIFYQKFWTELVDELTFDDPGQPLPKIANGTNLYLYPGKTRKAWISAYFAKSMKRAGVYFRCRNDNEGDKVYQHLGVDSEQIRKELGDEIVWNWEAGDGAVFRFPCDDVFDQDNRSAIKEFFKEKLNLFVNVIRPRMKGL